jgi:hypothetical protein
MSAMHTSESELTNIEINDTKQPKKVTFTNKKHINSLKLQHNNSLLVHQLQGKDNKSDVRRFQCKNIVDSCFFLEHREKYVNQLLYRDLDKEKVLADERISKMNEIFGLLKEFNDARDPQTLKKMFIYQDHQKQEYEEE